MPVYVYEVVVFNDTVKVGVIVKLSPDFQPFLVAAYTFIVNESAPPAAPDA